jgi:hypothetical protein
VNENEITETETETPTLKARLSRKALILVGATVGMIIAGGIVLIKSQESSEDAESDSDVDPELVSEINSITIDTV